MDLRRAAMSSLCSSLLLASKLSGLVALVLESEAKAKKCTELFA